MKPTPVIYDPYNANASTGLRRRLREIKFPLTRMDPVTLKYLQNYVKAPNIVVNGVPSTRPPCRQA